MFMLSPATTPDYGILKADLPHRRPDYGVLRPLDWLQAHRLEEAAASAVGPARILHPFCGARISTFLNRPLAADHTPVVVNLASQEYAKRGDWQAFDHRPSGVDRMVFRRGIDQ